MKWASACLTLFVLAGAVHAQTPGAEWFDLPVPGGERTLAALGLTPRERAYAFALAARLPSGDDSRLVPASRHLNDALHAIALPSLGESEDEDSLPIPTPLKADVWRDLLELNAGDDLLSALLRDRAAIRMLAGFSSTDASIRQLALRERPLVRRIYREASGAFALAARSLRIANGRVVVPGGSDAERLWSELAGASPSNPAAFIRALLTKDEGRLAWYFDTLARLEPMRMRAAWPDAPERRRLANARALYDTFHRVEVRWRVEDQPFRRPAADPWMVLNSADVRDGVVTGPSWPWLWDALYANGLLDRAAAARIERRRSAVMSLTSIAQAIAPESVRERKERFEMFRLAQRVFAAAQESEATDVAVAISGYRRYKALLLPLERMQITTPATWATLVETARYVDGAAGDREDALAAFQGAFAIVCRMWHVGTLDTTAAERLLLTLAEATRADGRVPRSVAQWITMTLTPAVAPQTVIDALAGPSPKDARAIAWEGLEYRLDFASAERSRLERIRAIVKAPSLDVALDSPRERDIAVALKALVYAVALGDPEGAVTLGTDIADRHDFGVGLPAHDDDETPWAMPVEVQIESKPWHVRGSIIGLELGLARLSLRHLSGDQMPNAPTLTMNDYMTLAHTAVSMRPSDFADIDRDEIVAALARGRKRVADAGGDLERLATLAREADLAPTSRQLLPWMAAHEPEALSQLFSLRDLLWLGQPTVPEDRLNRWGMQGRAHDGRLTLAMPRARSWEDFAGRAETGLMATQVPDLTLRLAEETARLGLPAALVPAMMSFAVPDYWYDARARFADDWLAMSHYAGLLSPERVEDYVAALAGSGVLRLPEAQR